MKRTTVKEIFIEIETIRVTRKRSVRKSGTQPRKSGVPNDNNLFVSALIKGKSGGASE